VAIANARLTYKKYQNFSAPRWKPGVQGRADATLLWASTSTKNPKYRDVV